MILWTGLAPWDFEFSFPGSLMYTFPTRTGAGGDGEEQSGGRGVSRRAATVSSRKKNGARLNQFKNYYMVESVEKVLHN